MSPRTRVSDAVVGPGDGSGTEVIWMRTRPGRLVAWLVLALAATTLAACDSGGGGHDERSSPQGSPTRADDGEPPPGWWRPTKGLSWQWQLDGEPIDQSIDVDVYDIDLFETPASTVQALQAQGRRVICYFSAGSWEPYRPDSDNFPRRLIGGPVDGWLDERWLDIRQLDALRPLLAARLDLCAEKGFDGAEPDWLDHHERETGFDISADDQLAFNLMLAEMAHERGLAIGLKNDLGQIEKLAEMFDFAVVEQCAEFGECEALAPFLDLDKPTFHAEYEQATSEFCAESRRLGLSSIRKHVSLDAWRESC